MIRSLRLRLLLGTSLATAGVLALLGPSIYYFTWRSLTAQFDDAMLTKARALASMVEQDGGKIVFDYDPKDMPEFLPGKRPEYFEVWLADGQVLARSLSLGAKEMTRPAAPTAPVMQTVTLPDGHHGRAATIAVRAQVQRERDEPTPVSPPAPRAATLTVAMPTRSMDETLERLAAILSTLCGSAVVISGLVLLWVVHRALRPVARLASDIGALRETDLSGRLSATGVPGELWPVVNKLNELFDRVARAFDREKSFTADAAHELRTPLAGLRTTIEVCRTRPRDATEYTRVLDKCGAIVTRMEGMVTSLLMLARAEAGQLPLERRDVDWAALAAESWAMLQPAADEKRLAVTWDAPAACHATGDPDKLRIVTQNLLNNAVAHADEGGAVRVLLQCTAGSATLEITNTGSQVAAADVPLLFKRFWRGDAARADAGLHCGLGLSVAQRLTALMGGHIEVTSERGGSFSVRLTIPASTAASPAP